MNLNDPDKKLRIAFGSPWKNIHPGLQHTLVGDLTLSNQFEALVGVNDDGAYVPLAAKEWTISEDYRDFKFKIDTSKVFPDGVHLKAQHFKDSWEAALHLEPLSSNNSTLDVLYKVDGFSDFKRSGKLTGVSAPDDETLEVRFSTPFRMALEHLSGNRFSAFREVKGKFLGTGAYLIDEVGPDRLRLHPNKLNPNAGKSDIDLSMVSSTDAVHALTTGEIDVMAYAIGVSDLKPYRNLSWIAGQEALHRAIFPNVLKGRLFESKEFRQALQFLATRYYANRPDALGNHDFTTIDSQVYLPLQAGRLDEQEVQRVVSKGEKSVAALQAATHKRPLILIETSEFSLRPMLEASGLAVSDKSRVVSKSDAIAISYSGKDVDIMPGSFGVASGDPDGIYHLLGTNGAIASPMSSNEIVAEKLEEGRKIVDREKIDPFYKEVATIILDEAPIVHLGFSKAVAIYRNDLVTVNEKILRRNEGHLNIYEAK